MKINDLKIKDYPRSLELFAEKFKKELGEKQSAILSETANKFKECYKKGKSGKFSWEIEISPKSRMFFPIHKSPGLPFDGYIDLTCKMKGQANFEDSVMKFEEYNVLIRVWSTDKEISYRDEIDSPKIKDKLEKKGWCRIIFSFRIERKNASAKIPEPMYHLHFGSKEEKEECYWFPDKFHVPRFCHFPMDLILLCEFIMANFLPDETEDLRQKPEWKSFIVDSQQLCIKPYVEKMIESLSYDKNTFLQNLSNV